MKAFDSTARLNGNTQARRSFYLLTSLCSISLLMFPVFSQQTETLFESKSSSVRLDSLQQIAYDEGSHKFTASPLQNRQSPPISETQDLTSSTAPSLMWAKRAGGENYDHGRGIATDVQDNCIVVGSFAGTARFDRKTLTSAGASDIFVAKYDSLGNVLWAKRAGGVSHDYANGVSTDSAGSIVVTGNFMDVAKFDSTTLTSVGYDDIFIAKYINAGDLLWAKRAGGEFYDKGYAVTTDKLGNIIVIGTFCGSATFETVTLTTNEPDNVNVKDIFLAKYDGKGNLLWVKQASAFVLESQVLDITTDEAGNILMTGSFEGTSIFDGDTLTSAGNTDLFLAKYNAEGQLTWVKRAGGVRADAACGIVSDNVGNCIITGYFSDTAFFENDQLISKGSADVFIAKYSATGRLAWARSAGGRSDDRAQAIAMDRIGNLIITGQFRDKTMFGMTILSSAGDRDIFLAKFTNQGKVLWAKRAGGTEYDQSWDIATDKTNHSIITGYFERTAFFDKIIISSAGYGDVFVAKLRAR